MRRVYTSTANFRAPYDDGGLTLTGLGKTWPSGRSYNDVSNYRAPYDSGYFQSNSLFGLGVTPAETDLLPEKVMRYVQAGEPVGTIWRDLGATSAQIPRWAWGLGAAGFFFLGYRSYKKFRKGQRTMSPNRRRYR